MSIMMRFKIKIYFTKVPSLHGGIKDTAGQPLYKEAREKPLKCTCFLFVFLAAKKHPLTLIQLV